MHPFFIVGGGAGGLDILTSSKALEVAEDSIILDSGRTIEAQLKIWTAGIKAPELLRSLGGLDTNHISLFVPAASNGPPRIPPQVAVYDPGRARASNQAPDEAALTFREFARAGDIAAVDISAMCTGRILLFIRPD